MSSVIPASMTTWRPPRSRTWRTRATSQPARATRARPGSIARRAGRRSSGTASSSAGSSRAKRSGLGTDLVERQDREPAADVERVERRQPAAEEPHDGQPAPDRVAPRVHGTELRADVQVDAARPDRAVGVRGDPFDEPGRLGLGHPELRRAIADGEPGDRLGRHVRVEPHEDVERRPIAASEPGPPRHPGDDLRLVGRFEGDPEERASRSAAARTAARRSASVLPTPSSVIRPSGDPGPSCDRPLAARDDVGTEPAGRDLGDDRPGRHWP